MIGFRTVIKGASLRVLLIALAMVTTFAGCKRQAVTTFGSCKRQTQKAGDYDSMAIVREVVENTDSPSDMRERAKEALSKWESGAPFPEPILILMLLQPLGQDGILYVLAVDKGPDLMGVRIREEHIDPNGTTRTLQEDYPAYVVFSPPAPDAFQGFPVFIRDRDQRKDERVWQEFLRLELDDWKRGDAGRTYHEAPPGSPNIWVSLPQPNNIRVFISVYDSAGHVSNALEIKR